MRLSSTMLNTLTPGSFALQSCSKIGTSVDDVCNNPSLRSDIIDQSFEELARSTATVTTITIPLTTNCQSGDTPSKPKPLFKTPIIKQPRTVPQMEPRPPESDVPPITTAAIELSSSPIPTLGSAASSRAARSRPPTPASAPPSMYT